MNKVNDIQEELKGLGCIKLAAIGKAMPYSVPIGYFENFSNTLHKYDKEEIEESAGNWGKQLPYNVPDGYFEALPAKIAASVKLDRAGRKIPFEVPGGYFDLLPAKILLAAKESSQQAARIIPFTRAKIFGAIKWAAAAVLLIGIGIGSYSTFRSTPNSAEMILSSVPGNEINEYIQHNYRIDADRVVGSNSEINNIQLDKKDIIQYLDENGWD